MIILRNDDILNDTSAGKFQGKEFDRFRFIHKMSMHAGDKLLHRPTILCTEIEQYPEAIELVKEETKLGNMDPQLHGFEHEDYVHLPKGQIRDMLNKSLDWFNDNLETSFSIWATPWGGTDEKAVEVCSELGVILQTTQGTLTPGKVLREVKVGRYGIVDGKTILHHWWDRGLNIFRLCEVLHHGSWEAAKAADERNWFK